MGDKELELRWNGELYVANRHNTYLFTFFGRLAMYNHVYLVPIQEEDEITGGYIWHDHKAYEPVVDFIQTYNLPQRLNSNEVAECDIDAYNQAHPSGLWLPGDAVQLPKGEYKDLEDLYFNDSFPEEWNE